MVGGLGGVVVGEAGHQLGEGSAGRPPRERMAAPNPAVTATQVTAAAKAMIHPPTPGSTAPSA